MIVNQNEICFDFEEDAAKNELIQQLMLNPIKYREFKQNINRINNVDNEINFIKSQSYTKTVDYAKDIQISKEDYDLSMSQSTEIVDSITEENIIDIISHKKLLSTQRHILEIFAYLIGFEYFDWNIIRDKLNLYEVKHRISLMNYDKFEIKKINVLLSKICKHKQFSLIAAESGMNLIYEWSKAQLKIILYLYQNNMLKKKKTSVTTSQNMNMNMKIDVNSNANGNVNVNLALNAPGRNSIGGESNNNISAITTNNQLYSVYDNNNNQNRKTGNVIQKKSEVNNNDNSNKVPIVKGNDNSVQVNTNNANVNKSNESVVMITALPNIMNDNNKNIQTKLELSNKPISKVNHVQVELKGFDYAEKFIKREEKIIEYLPLLKNRTFQQMRKYYNLQAKRGKDFERRHMKELRPFGDQDNKQKILNLIGLNKIEILDKLPYHKLKEIIEKI